MGVMLAERGQIADGAHSGPPFCYSIYGMSVSSDVPLPIASALPEALSAPDVVVRRLSSLCPPLLDGPAVAQISCPVHGTIMREYRRADGIWIWLQAVGIFHIALDATWVGVYPDDWADERALGLALGGPVMLFIRHKRGWPSLHASAVVTAHGSVAFLGPRGRGKSTMAASFLRRGALLLTDDALPLAFRDDGIYGMPGPPFMKVWHETAQHTLELADELPNLMSSVDKKLLALEGRYALARTPARLRALYLLDRYDPAVVGQTEVALRTLGQREALLALLAYTSNREYLLPSDDASYLRSYARLLAQAPVQILSYPGGFAYQDAVCERILKSLEER
jgi:hypothetical protein